jgi:hypothetical protein
LDIVESLVRLSLHETEKGGPVRPSLFEIWRRCESARIYFLGLTSGDTSTIGRDAGFLVVSFALVISGATSTMGREVVDFDGFEAGLSGDTSTIGREVGFDL